MNGPSVKTTIVQRANVGALEGIRSAHPEMFREDVLECLDAKTLKPGVRYKLPIVPSVDFEPRTNPIVRLAKTGPVPPVFKDPELITDTLALDAWKNEHFATLTVHDGLQVQSWTSLFQLLMNLQGTVNDFVFLVEIPTLQSTICIDVLMILAQFGLVVFEWVVVADTHALKVEFVPLGRVLMPKRQLLELNYWSTYFRTVSPTTEVPQLEQFVHNQTLRQIRTRVMSQLIHGFKELIVRRFHESRAEVEILETTEPVDSEPVEMIRPSGELVPVVGDNAAAQFSRPGRTVSEPLRQDFFRLTSVEFSNPCMVKVYDPGGFKFSCGRK